MPRPQEHIPLIVELVKLLRPNVYVELGAQYGQTFNAVTATGVVKRAVAVDLRLKGLKKRKGMKTEFYQMSTDSFLQRWKDPIDFLFIDADHTYLQAKADFFNFQSYVPFCTGIILLHDTHPTKDRVVPERCGDVWKLAREIHEHFPLFEIVTIPGATCGLSIVRHTPDKHMEWL